MLVSEKVRDRDSDGVIEVEVVLELKKTVSDCVNDSDSD